MSKVIALGALFAGFSFAACGKKEDPPKTTTTGEYATTYKAIIDAKCVPCHAAGAQAPALDSLAGVKTAKDRMVARMKSAASPMPPSGRIDSTDDGKKLVEWLSGAELK